MVAIPWPGTYWDTFPAKGQPQDWHQCKAEASEQGAEIIMRAREGKTSKLVVLVDDVDVRTRVLELVVKSCEAAGTDMTQAGAE
jgi:hypothetical protein